MLSTTLSYGARTFLPFAVANRRQPSPLRGQFSFYSAGQTARSGGNLSNAILAARMALVARCVDFVMARQHHRLYFLKTFFSFSIGRLSAWVKVRKIPPPGHGHSFSVFSRRCAKLPHLILRTFGWEKQGRGAGRRGKVKRGWEGPRGVGGLRAVACAGSGDPRTTRVLAAKLRRSGGRAYAQQSYSRRIAGIVWKSLGGVQQCALRKFSLKLGHDMC